LEEKKKKKGYGWKRARPRDYTGKKNRLGELKQWRQAKLTALRTPGEELKKASAFTASCTGKGGEPSALEKRKERPYEKDPADKKKLHEWGLGGPSNRKKGPTSKKTQTANQQKKKEKLQPACVKGGEGRI